MLTIASGGVISGDNPARPLFVYLHRFMPFLTRVSAFALVFLLQ